MLRWNGIPGLGCTKVEIVDAVEIHVFRVPRECGLPHAKVQVSCVHSFNLHIIFFIDAIQDGPQMIDVPHILIRIIQTA